MPANYFREKVIIIKFAAFFSLNGCRRDEWNISRYKTTMYEVIEIFGPDSVL